MRLIRWVVMASALVAGCVSEPADPIAEICDNVVDDDGDGLTDCSDDDCLGRCPEVCDDELDNDGDGLVDCTDDDCDGRCAEDCGDGRDNDGDGKVDCADRDCTGGCEEVCDDGIDNDGDGRVDCVDSDCSSPSCDELCSDGFDNDGDDLVDCSDPDCNGPSCEELCSDGFDNDGDRRIDCDDPDCHGQCEERCDDRADNDGDGAVDCDDSECSAVCDTDGDGFRDTTHGGLDCDDEVAEINPAASEICNGWDDDCNGLVDEDDLRLDVSTLTRFYADMDGDGFGDPDRSEWRCFMVEGRAANPSDCDDDDPAIHPDAVEVCDERVDNDCDGLSDDDDPDRDPSLATVWFEDHDLDGFGGTEPPGGVLGCRPPAREGWADTDDDCDDFEPAVGGATDWLEDLDEDGVGAGEGIGVMSCDSPGAGFAPESLGEDCNDDDPLISPLTEEVCEDGVDQDCDGSDDLCDSFIYAAEGSGLWGFETHNIYEINTRTGTVRDLGYVDRPITSLSFADDGTMYGIYGHGADYYGGDDEDVFSIDLETGTLTPVFESDTAQSALAWSDGALWVADRGSRLIRYDLATGVRTDRAFPAVALSDYGYDLACDSSGRVLYGNEHDVWELDQISGGLTLSVRPVGMPVALGGAMAFHNDELWMTYTSMFMSTELYAVDLTTGSVRATGIVIPSGLIDALASPTP